MLAAMLVLPVLAIGQADKKLSLNDLALEVNALQTLYVLNLEETQLKKLKDWAKETAQKPSKREPGKASKEYRDKLEQLRTALAAADEDDRIGDLNDDLDELREKEKPAIDDDVEFTDAARQRVPAFVRLLKVQQVKSLLDSVADDLDDPLDLMIAGLDDSRSLTGKEWMQRRDELVDEAVRLAAGIDEKKADKLEKNLTAILDKAHFYSPANFKAKRGELEKQLRDQLGEVGPLDVMRNVVERSLAELLSNPRLPAALKARLKDSK